MKNTTTIQAYNYLKDSGFLKYLDCFTDEKIKDIEIYSVDNFYLSTNGYAYGAAQACDIYEAKDINEERKAEGRQPYTWEKWHGIGLENYDLWEYFLIKDIRILNKTLRMWDILINNFGDVSFEKLNESFIMYQELNKKLKVKANIKRQAVKI